MDCFAQSSARSRARLARNDGPILSRPSFKTGFHLQWVGHADGELRMRTEILETIGFTEALNQFNSSRSNCSAIPARQQPDAIEKIPLGSEPKTKINLQFEFEDWQFTPTVTLLPSGNERLAFASRRRCIASDTAFNHIWVFVRAGKFRHR